MEEKFTFPGRLKNFCYVLVALGILTFIWGFITAPDRAWSNLLLNNFYFLSIAVGAAFFMALQYIAQAGWSAGFKRVPEAISTYIPVAAILFIFVLFGVHTLYHWSHQDAMMHDALLAHKSPYLNVPFFIIRLILYFSLWIFMTLLLRRISLKEDAEGGLAHFERSEYYSRIYIFILAITFTFASFDWLMSIDPHWYSTIFSFKTFASAFYHGSAVLVLIILLLHDRGYFSFLNESHLHDFSRYIFMLAIIYGYLWFAQFMLIWYGNIPEETIYYVVRWDPQWKPLFFLDIILNWAIPFLILMPRSTSRNKLALKIVIVFIMIGHWVDLYLHIFPGVDKIRSFGLLEVGSFIGFAGLFIFVVLRSLGKAPLIPSKHPYLEESIHHHF
jgi:hypothetical protein